ncbi:uncharacterized protein LOC126971364 [Leptidea sinapis]|uniref:uncharacterized protein LOC126971364 n=1 Tax=Leptidea sinapis TaxID=189913 RepID=UPI0021C299DF|nr:uncharacterized protein LOC126971364 [Leptidea sinapis]
MMSQFHNNTKGMTQCSGILNNMHENNISSHQCIDVQIQCPDKAEESMTEYVENQIKQALRENLEREEPQHEDKAEHNSTKTQGVPNFRMLGLENNDETDSIKTNYFAETNKHDSSSVHNSYDSEKREREELQQEDKVEHNSTKTQSVPNIRMLGLGNNNETDSNKTNILEDTKKHNICSVHNSYDSEKLTNASVEAIIKEYRNQEQFNSQNSVGDAQENIIKPKVRTEITVIPDGFSISEKDYFSKKHQNDTTKKIVDSKNFKMSMDLESQNVGHPFHNTKALREEMLFNRESKLYNAPRDINSIDKKSFQSIETQIDKAGTSKVFQPTNIVDQINKTKIGPTYYSDPNESLDKLLPLVESTKHFQNIVNEDYMEDVPLSVLKRIKEVSTDDTKKHNICSVHNSYDSEKFTKTSVESSSTQNYSHDTNASVDAIIKEYRNQEQFNSQNSVGEAQENIIKPKVRTEITAIHDGFGISEKDCYSKNHQNDTTKKIVDSKNFEMSMDLKSQNVGHPFHNTKAREQNMLINRESKLYNAPRDINSIDKKSFQSIETQIDKAGTSKDFQPTNIVEKIGPTYYSDPNESLDKLLPQAESTKHFQNIFNEDYMEDVPLSVLKRLKEVLTDESYNIISLSEHSESDGYNSSDFEFIDEEEAKLNTGLQVMNFNIDSLIPDYFKEGPSTQQRNHDYDELTNLFMGYSNELFLMEVKCPANAEGTVAVPHDIHNAWIFHDYPEHNDREAIETLEIIRGLPENRR